MALIHYTYFCLFASLSSHFPPDCSKEQTQSWRSYLRFVLWWTWFVIVLCPAKGSGHDTRDAIGLVDLWCWSDASTFGGSICPCLYVAAICVVSWKISFLFCCVCPPTQEGDYPAATQLCLECQNAIETYKHFTCVKWVISCSSQSHTVLIACGMRAES